MRLGASSSAAPSKSFAECCRNCRSCRRATCQQAMIYSEVRGSIWSYNAKMESRSMKPNIGRICEFESRAMDVATLLTGTILFSHSSISRAPTSIGDGDRAMAAARPRCCHFRAHGMNEKSICSNSGWGACTLLSNGAHDVTGQWKQ